MSIPVNGNSNFDIKKEIKKNPLEAQNPRDLQIKFDGSKETAGANNANPNANIVRSNGQNVKDIQMFGSDSKNKTDVDLSDVSAFASSNKATTTKSYAEITENAPIS